MRPVLFGSWAPRTLAAPSAAICAAAVLMALAAFGRAAGAEGELDARRQPIERMPISALRPRAADLEAQIERMEPPAHAEDERSRAIDAEGAFPAVLVLTPGGPLLVKIVLVVDGQSYQTSRTLQAQKLLASLDANRDGHVDWQEAASSPRFMPGRFGFRFHAQGIKLDRVEHYARYFRQRHDTNGNGLLDLGEVVALAEGFYGDATFLMQGFARGEERRGPETALLDANGDGTLSPDEIRQAGARLATRDRNGNELLELVELGSGSPGLDGAFLPIAVGLSPSDATLNNWRIQQITRRNAAAAQAAKKAGKPAPAPETFLRAPTTPDEKWSLYFEDLHALWLEHYGRAGKLSIERLTLVRGMAERLDADGNGTIDLGELAALRRAPAQIVLEARVTRSGPQAGCAFAVRSLDAELGVKDLADQAVRVSGDVLTIPLRGAQLRFQASHRFDQPMERAGDFLKRHDADKDGVLTRTEAPATEDEPAWLFDLWDADRDGRVTKEEIAEIDEQQFASPGVSLGVAEPPYALFHALDLSGDDRLSPREMRLAAERIRAFDLNGDGAISADEFPHAMNLHLSFSADSQAMGANPQFSGSRSPAARSGPEWFLRMDRNGDGDVSPREFIGSREQFDRLDANRDGFIEPAEAGK